MGIKISVIIPTYNRASYILETVTSVLQQTYSDTEIIVIDDGSTDNTKEVLHDYISSGKIVYKWQENNGRSSARNHGARISTGDFLLFLDSDDLLDRSALCNLAKLAFDNRRSAVFAGLVGLFSNIENIDYKNHFNCPASFKDKQITVGSVADTFLSIGSFIIRREAFFKNGGFVKEFEPAEDLDFSIKSLHDNLFTWSGDFVAVNKRRHDSNTDDTLLHRASERICKHYITLLKKKELPNFSKDRRPLMSGFYQRLYNDSLYLHQRLPGTRYLAKTIFYDTRKLFSLKLMKLFLYLWVKG